MRNGAQAKVNIDFERNREVWRKKDKKSTDACVI